MASDRALHLDRSWLNGFDIPACQALLVRLVGGQDLPNAIALNASIFNGARLVGPAIAGVLIGLIGEGPVFVLNAASYLAVLGALWTVEVRDKGIASRESVLRTMGAGFRYAFGFPPIRAILVLLTLISLAGALVLASRGSVQGLGLFISRCSGLFGAALMDFAWSRSVWISAGLLLIAGFGIMATTASMNTILQTIVEEQMRGRVMALYTMAFIGLSPMGALLGGALADRIGAPLTVGGGGAACVLLSFWFRHQLPYLREFVRPIY